MKLLEEIERINDEDVEIRKALKRAERINETKVKYEEKLRTSTSTLNTSLLSPIKGKSVPNSALSKMSY